MKYCEKCGSEYEDSITECADCPGSVLVDKPPQTAPERAATTEQDTRKFVRAGTADDPLTAEDYVRLLESERIAVFSRPRRAGTVDALTTGVTSPWWEIMVPEEHVARASSLLKQEKLQLESTSEEAARAAEEEEEETEKKKE